VVWATIERGGSTANRYLGIKAPGQRNWSFRETDENQAGSCNPVAGTIRLNIELEKKPKQCLQYVVVHELVHLIERRHNHLFLSIMDKHLPQWRLYRQELNTAPL
jgi:predicted metal-dependent hydrolase